MTVDPPTRLEFLRSFHLFNKLNEEELTLVQDALEEYAFTAGQAIYNAGDEAEGFYLIFNGRVRLSVDTPDDEIDFALLESGNYFGQEALSLNRVRDTFATAQTPTIVFRLEREALRELAGQIRKLGPAMEMVEKVFDLSLRTNFSWLGPREVVHYISRTHPLILFARLFVPGLIGALTIFPLIYLWLVVLPELIWPLVLLVIVMLAIGGWVVWTVVDWANDYSIITNRRILYIKKMILLYESRQEVPMEAVLSYELRRDQWGRVFDYGNFHIRTYTGQVVLPYLDNPELVMNLFLVLRERNKRSDQSEYHQKVRSILEQRLSENKQEHEERMSRPQMTPSEEPVYAERAESSIREVLDSLFRLKLVEGRVITYWTHWWMLVTRSWIPLLILLALVSINIISAAKWLPISLSSTLLLTISLGFFIFLWLLYEYVDWRNDRYVIGSEQLIDLYKKPLGQEQKSTAPIKNIQSIESERAGIIGLVLNYGMVYIRIGNTEFTFDNVPDPSEVQRELFQRLLEINQGERKREQARMEENMAEWIETYHELKDEGRIFPPNPPVQGTGFG